MYTHPKTSKQYNSQKTGYTLIEILVVTVIFGIVTAIAIRSWLSFLNDQSLSNGQSQIFNALKQAQNLAKTEKRSVTVSQTTNWIEVDGRNRVNFEEKITATPRSIIFDFRGNPKVDNLPSTFTVSIGERKNCVKVTTLIGTIRKFTNNECEDKE